MALRRRDQRQHGEQGLMVKWVRDVQLVCQPNANAVARQESINARVGANTAVCWGSVADDHDTTWNGNLLLSA